ncbi:MAG: tail fiber domain-containing protein [Flavobacteriaceae bacterium]|nr:tail fiber domain-containing protein [Flavobacteriaceae bacterium]
MLITSIVQGQLAFYGDVFVSSNNQLHIAFQNTYFNGSKIKTAGEGASEGVVSFSSQSRWQKLKKNSFVEGSVKIYHKGVFSFPIGSEDTFSPITLELLENSGFIQTKFTKSVPHSFAQLNNTFETPFYHYWSWQSKGEVTARIKAYWFEQHRLDRLSFARINPTELYVALYLNSKWEAVLGHHAPNPFTLQKPLKQKAKKLFMLQSKQFNYIDSPKDTQFGFLAQELEKVYPELVYGVSENDTIGSINYLGLIPLLLEVVQKQQKKIDQLKKEIKKM